MKLTRSALLFGTGLIGITAETIYSLRYKETPDPTLLLIFGAMLGLPVFLNQDLKGHNGRGKDDKHPPTGDGDSDSSARSSNSDSPKR